ncbi:unnamed protein product [Oppiella nova]|uniref:Amino acid permease/ SLC12A domain-containing protein n=1 Tax=Oppiella nova TaxID=334625 RepID=A0A7R9L9Y9_9ACAR|nr:unnamed protein product [Oppiella nova]CAG2158212.1 unnamed protein product [Oppiella nova]
MSNENLSSSAETDLIGPWAGYFVGWTYWLCWITIVKLFGELEFWFALIKIIAIVVLILVGFWMIFTGFTSAATGQVASFTHLWDHGGMFPKGFEGFLAGFQIAIFAFVGVELVGTTAAETKDPEKNLPKAVNSIPILTPWNMIDPKVSPFVNLFSQAGIAAAAIIMNLVVLSSVMSSMNSGVFSTSRMLFGLSREDQGPKAFVLVGCGQSGNLQLANSQDYDKRAKYLLYSKDASKAAQSKAKVQDQTAIADQSVPASQATSN